MTIPGIRKSAIVGCCLATVLFLTVLGLKVSSYVEAQQQLESKQLELAEIEREVREIKLSLDRFKQEETDFQRVLFREKDVPAFLDGLSEFAKESNVNIVDLQTKKFSQVILPKELGQSSRRQKVRSEKNQGPQKQSLDEMLTLAAMPIQFQVEGTYASFVKFLNYLEKFEQLLSISNLEIASGKEYPMLNCEFTLKIYSFKTLEDLDTTQ